VHTCVSRRYRDVVKLHSQLKQRLPRITLPDFKPMRGSTGGLFAASEDLVLKRRHQIAAFLCQLLQVRQCKNVEPYVSLMCGRVFIYVHAHGHVRVCACDTADCLTNTRTNTLSRCVSVTQLTAFGPHALTRVCLHVRHNVHSWLWWQTAQRCKRFYRRQTRNS
jgi:hypothetical protein